MLVYVNLEKSSQYRGLVFIQIFVGILKLISLITKLKKILQFGELRRQVSYFRGP